MTNRQGSRPSTTAHWTPATLAALCLAVACAPSVPPPAPLKPQAAAKTVEEVVAASEDTRPIDFVYSPIGKRDPFRDPRTERRTVVVPGRATDKLTELQMHDIDKMRLQFTTTGSSSPMAVVLDPKGKAHPVRIGDFIGRNWGKVSHIGREEITITETIADPQSGRIYPVFIPLRMPMTDAEERASAEARAGLDPEGEAQ